MKTALITGITGQDGSYLAEQLLEKGYQVHGMIRRSSSFNTERIDHLYHDTRLREEGLFHLHHGDLTDSSNLNRLLEKIEPSEIYNLGAQSHVKVSFEVPEYTAEVDAIGTLRFLDAIKETGLEKSVKFYQASTSELYGKVREVPQSETTPFHPRSPYGVAKLYGFWIVVNYREAYGLHASNGILFNHESPRRGETFVTRKITRAVGRIACGLQDRLELGNLDAKRSSAIGRSVSPGFPSGSMARASTRREFARRRGGKSFPWRPVIFGPPRSSSSSGTPAGPGSGWAGSPKPALANW